ncbi:hypothetical protein BGZ93_003160 [Podila epicladia]|nr:hypothetical protein BGZ93_003160 [Podila epicladia]
MKALSSLAVKTTAAAVLVHAAPVPPSSSSSSPMTKGDDNNNAFLKTHDIVFADFPNALGQVWISRLF